MHYSGNEAFRHEAAGINESSDAHEYPSCMRRQSRAGSNRRASRRANPQQGGLGLRDVLDAVRGHRLVLREIAFP